MRLDADRSTVLMEMDYRNKIVLFALHDSSDSFRIMDEVIGATTRAPVAEEQDAWNADVNKTAWGLASLKLSLWKPMANARTPKCRSFWRGNEDWLVSLEELKEYRDERLDEEWYMEEDGIIGLLCIINKNKQEN